MKIIRYRGVDGAIHFAGSAAATATIPATGALPAGWQDLTGDPLSTPELVDGTPPACAELLAPVVPTQILCIGLNYRRHAAETGAKVSDHPVLFVKGPNALQDPGKPIELPRHLRSDEVDYECELAVVIGRDCRNATIANALDFVAGYTCANDVSSRDWQIKNGGGQWCRGKFFDTFAPLGPCLVTTDELGAAGDLAIRTELNGEVAQDSRTSDMIFDVPTLIAFLSGSTTLPAGTVILTGTPEGVGMARNPQRYLRAGDEVTIEIEGIGRLTNPVREEATD